LIIFVHFNQIRMNYLQKSCDSHLGMMLQSCQQQ